MHVSPFYWRDIALAVIREIQTVAGTALPIYESFSVRRCRYAPEGAAAGRICLVSGIHGDETLGQLILFEVSRRIMAQPERLLGVVDVYPMLNPLGLDIGERMVPVGTRLDMNRSFPGNPDGTPLERICRQLTDDMQGADLVLDIHSGTQHKHELCEVRVMAKQPAPLVSLARTLCPDLIWVHPDRIAYDASLTGALCGMGTPALLLQADERGGDPRQTAANVADGILACMAHLGLWDGGEAAPLPEIPCIRREDEVVRITCQNPGMYVPEPCIGTKVTAGQLLGRIVDALGGAVLEEITAPCAGLVFSQRCYSAVYPGTLIARVFSKGREVNA